MTQTQHNERAFIGFPLPTSNFFSMPNAWTDITADITSLAELKVIEYVLRHTWGFHEFGKPKPITTDEFMHGRKKDDGTRMDKGTGLSNRSVIDGLVRAVEHGYLIVHKDDSDKARIEKAYALKMTSSGSDVKKVHSENRCEESSQPAMKKVHSRVKNLHSDCEESSQRSEKETKERHLKKEREKDSQPTTVQEPSPSSAPNVSLSLSSQNEKKTDSLEEWYSLFDRLLQEKGYPSNFRVPRNEKNAGAIQELISMNATAEQAIFVLNHIWDDKDTFWRQHRGKITTIASQFTTRVCEMHAPAPKQRTSSGLPNWTADKTMGAPVATDHAEKPQRGAVQSETINVSAKPVNAKPATTQSAIPALPLGYTRLRIEKPSRARTAQGRMMEQNSNNDRKEL